MDVELAKLEQEFRRDWRAFEPSRYAALLDCVPERSQIELLARLCSVELEYAYQPPPAPSAAMDVMSSSVGPNDSSKLGGGLGGDHARVAGGQSDRSVVVAHEEPPSGDSDEDDDARIRPCVRLFLLRFPQLSAHPELVMRLVVLEYALRLRHDRVRPNPDSYLSLCGSWAERLSKLLELTESKIVALQPATGTYEVGRGDSTIKDVSLSNSITLDPLPLNIGCFLLIRQLGRGGMGFVHLAIDLRSIAPVAVKIMRRVDSWSVYRFIEEFSWLSQLSHPNLIQLYDAFCDSDLRYFSMELVEGQTIKNWFRCQPSNSQSKYERLRDALGQIASAIHYLHGHGVLHCDIKCSNIMLTTGDRAVLLDLGLAVRVGQASPFVGTLPYMAPEILGGASATAASDWFSFGVVLHEILADTFPPLEADAETVVNKKKRYAIDYQRLEKNLADSPPDLARLCVDLLNIQPDQRPSGSEVQRRLGAGGTSDSGFISHQECVGRQPKLLKISEAIAQDEGSSNLVVIRGESGMGKTTVLQHWSKHFAPMDNLLISVRCYRQDHTPVRLLNALVQELGQATTALPSQMWKPSLESRTKFIRVVFPQVRHLLDGGQQSTHEPPNAPPDTTRNVSIESLVGWLIDISHQRRMIVCVDDAQWADIESLHALRRMISHESGFHGSLILVDESPEGRIRDFFDQRDADGREAEQSIFKTHLKLPPLSQIACLELLDSWVARVSTEMTVTVASNIAKRSGGNPFLLQELFRAYLFHTRRGDISGSDWLAMDSQSGVRRRFGMLPIRAENILQYLAVAEQPIGFHQLQMVSRELPRDLQYILVFLAAQGWIRSQGEGLAEAVEIAHDRFRRVVLESMPAQRLHRRHYRTARILSSETPPPWARIARHYWAAENFRQAATCYLEAARVAIASAALDEAIDYLERACHPDAERSEEEHLRVQELKADCLVRVGNSLAAAELYDRLRLEAGDPHKRLSLQCRAGEQWLRAGQLSLGMEHLRPALRELGFGGASDPFTGLRVFASLCKAAWMRPARSSRNLHAPRGDRDRQTVPSKPAFSENERVLNRIAAPLTFLDNKLGPDLIVRMTALADARGSDFDRSVAESLFGILLSFGGRGWRGRALQRLRNGRRLAEICDSDEARATHNLCMYVWHTQRGQLSAALRRGQTAIAAYQRCPTGSQWEQQFLRWAMLGNYVYANRLRQLRSSTESLRAGARHRQDPMSLFWMHVSAAHWADLVGDQTEQAIESLAVASEAIENLEFQSPRFFLRLNRAQLALYLGNQHEARDILLQDWSQMSRAMIFSTNHYRWLALITRISSNLMILRDKPKEPQVLRDARRCVRQLRNFEQKAFAAYGEAFGLAVEASQGVIAPPAHWLATTEQLHQLGHHLLAHALKWHASEYLSSEDWTQQRLGAEAALTSEGCVAPERFLNMILPLPANRRGCDHS